MFEPIAGLPDGVVGFEAVGNVGAADYEDVLMPAIARVAEGAGQFRRFGLAERDAAIAWVAGRG